MSDNQGGTNQSPQILYFLARFLPRTCVCLLPLSLSNLLYARWCFFLDPPSYSVFRVFPLLVTPLSIPNHTPRLGSTLFWCTNFRVQHVFPRAQHKQTVFCFPIYVFRPGFCLAGVFKCELLGFIEMKIVEFVVTISDIACQSRERQVNLL